LEARAYNERGRPSVRHPGGVVRPAPNTWSIAAVLARLEALTGKRFVEHFDLIAGTSTSGLIAIGLGMDASAQQILD